MVKKVRRYYDITWSVLGGRWSPAGRCGICYHRAGYPDPVPAEDTSLALFRTTFFSYYFLRTLLLAALARVARVLLRTFAGQVNDLT